MLEKLNTLITRVVQGGLIVWSILLIGYGLIRLDQFAVGRWGEPVNLFLLVVFIGILLFYVIGSLWEWVAAEDGEDEYETFKRLRGIK
jgi:hypothetical protein